jgi:uncharacterized membrane protein
MRVDDYRYYGLILLVFGSILIVVGIFLPVSTTTVYRLLWWERVDSPFLPYGIALVILGIVLVVLSHIFLREYRFRTVISR